MADYPVFDGLGRYVMTATTIVGEIALAADEPGGDELRATSGTWFGVDTDGVYRIRGYAVDPTNVSFAELLAHGTKVRIEPPADMVAMYGSRGVAIEAMAAELGLTFDG